MSDKPSNPFFKRSSDESNYSNETELDRDFNPTQRGYQRPAFDGGSNKTQLESSANPPNQRFQQSGQKTELPGPGGQSRRRFEDSRQKKTQLQFNEDEYTGPIGILVVKRPLPRRGDIHKVKGEASIGSDGSNDISLIDNFITGVHAKIWFDEEDTTDATDPVFYLADTASKNGTFVNPEGEKSRSTRIKEWVRLKENDEIHIGDYIFVFKMLVG